jgi:hypothetical protein
MRQTTNLHRITITQAGPGAYATKGAVTLPAAFNPVRAAALALLAKGADPHAKLAATWEGCSIAPCAIGTLARAYTPPRLNFRAGPVTENF